MLFRILLIMMLASLSGAAQTQVFRWSDELCDYAGTFEKSKVTVSQLQNTLDLLVSPNPVLAVHSAVFKKEDISKLNVAKLDAEYAERSSRLRKAEIVNKPYWQDLRAKKQKVLEQSYRLARAEMLAFKDPNALREYKDAPACSTRFAEPLIAGGDALLAAWREVNEESRKRNSDPDRVRRRYEEQLASDDRLQFAFIEVMGFGFHNCANDLIYDVDAGGSLADEFKKLFKSVKTISCDEP